MSTLADRVSTLTFDNSDFDFDHLDLGLSDSDDDKKASKGLARGPGIGRPKGAPGGRTKECPSCGAMVGVSVKECKNCDHTFTAKSALAPTTTAQEESDNIRDYFPFEPEKHDDGSYKIQAILGRRLRTDAARKYLRSNVLGNLSATEAKFDHEYLVKYKDISYHHCEQVSTLGDSGVAQLSSWQLGPSVYSKSFYISFLKVYLEIFILS